MGLSKTEAKILDTLTTKKRGNAYGIWKLSGLKHYPTVLRALKKLEEQRLAQVVSVSGKRGEKVYVPTLGGVLISYVLNRDENKIVEMVTKNSSKFRELYKIEKDDHWAFSAVRNMIADVYAKKEPRSFDEAIEDVVADAIVDTVTDGVFNRNKEAMDWLLKLPKVKWVREMAVNWIENEQKRVRKMMNDLDELKEGLID